MTSDPTTTADNIIAEQVAEWAANLTPAGIPPAVRTIAENVLLDFAGNCVSVRNMDYIRSLTASWDGEGACRKSVV